MCSFYALSLFFLFLYALVVHYARDCSCTCTCTCIRTMYTFFLMYLCREILEDVRANGTPALERIQTSGSVAAYELALVLR